MRDETLKIYFFSLFANFLFCYDSFLFSQPLTCSIVQIPLSTFSASVINTLDSQSFLEVLSSKNVILVFTEKHIDLGNVGKSLCT